MRILVIMTGGTIGSVTTDGVTDVGEGAKRELLVRYQGTYPCDGVEFKVIQPYNCLSENLTPGHWEALHQTIRGAGVESYDGVILTHGSDTLSYTSAMCAHLYGGLGIPIVLTAASHPLDYEGSNGLDNFHTCVTLIASKLWKGVFTAFRNNKGEDEVHLAER